MLSHFISSLIAVHLTGYYTMIITDDLTGIYDNLKQHL